MIGFDEEEEEGTFTQIYIGGRGGGRGVAVAAAVTVVMVGERLHWRLPTATTDAAVVVVGEFALLLVPEGFLPLLFHLSPFDHRT